MTLPAIDQDLDGSVCLTTRKGSFDKVEEAGPVGQAARLLRPARKDQLSQLTWPGSGSVVIILSLIPMLSIHQLNQK